jgi:hypothetical protein
MTQFWIALALLAAVAVGLGIAIIGLILNAFGSPIQRNEKRASALYNMWSPISRGDQ